MHIKPTRAFKQKEWNPKDFNTQPAFKKNETKQTTKLNTFDIITR